jgi:hypothetical protein
MTLTHILFSVPHHVLKRQKFEKRQEKNAIAADIEGDPLANDDEPEQEDLPEWSAPTLTGGESD